MTSSNEDETDRFSCLVEPADHIDVNLTQIRPSPTKAKLAEREGP